MGLLEAAQNRRRRRGGAVGHRRVGNGDDLAVEFLLRGENHSLVARARHAFDVRRFWHEARAVVFLFRLVEVLAARVTGDRFPTDGGDIRSIDERNGERFTGRGRLFAVYASTM